jgi:hypothetical protein
MLNMILKKAHEGGIDILKLRSSDASLFHDRFYTRRKGRHFRKLVFICDEFGAKVVSYR